MSIIPGKTRPVGRPRKRYDAVYRTYYLPVYIVSKLSTYPNQTAIVIKALENFFEVDGNSDEWMLKRIQELDAEKLKLLKSLEERRKKEQIEQEQRLQDEQGLKNNFYRLLRRLDNSRENFTQYPSVSSIVGSFEIELSDDQYSKICDAHRTGRLDFDFFKSLLRGNND